MGEGDQTTLRADNRRLVVIEIQPDLPRAGLSHLHCQDALATLVAGTKIGVDPFDARVSLQQLQSLLERLDLQWRPRAQHEAIAQVAAPKPVSSLDVDARQGPFDDLYLNHTIFHVLIRNDGAGGDVAVIDV